MEPYAFELRTGKIEKATADSCAFDLFYAGIEPLNVTDTPIAVPTGVRTAFDPRLRAQILEKSGLALKGLQVFGGVIDADYRDEWKVIVRFPPFQQFAAESLEWVKVESLENRWYVIQPGQKIAQFVLVELPIVSFYALEGAELIIKKDVRTGGLGSTGLFSTKS